MVNVLAKTADYINDLESQLAQHKQVIAELVEMLIEADPYVASYIFHVREIPQCYGDKPTAWRKKLEPVIARAKALEVA